MKVQTIKNIGTLKVLMVVFCLTNAEAAYSGMSGAEFARIQGGFESASKAATETLNTQLTKFSVQDNLMGAKASADSSFLKTQANDMAKQYGGEYGTDAMDIAQSCFNIPSFNYGIGNAFDFNFCGMNTLMGKAKALVKGYADSIFPPAETPRTEVEKKVETPKGVPTQTKANNSIKNCIEGVDKGCSSSMKEAAISEKSKGSGPGGNSTTMAVKQLTKPIAYDSDKPENQICVDTEWNDGTTASYTCRKDAVDSLIENDEKRNELISGNSKLLDSSEKEVRQNMIKSNEKIETLATDRINTLKELRDDYNVKYNPSILAVNDVETLKENSFYERNKDMLTKDPTMYIVPVVDEETKQFSFTKFGLEKYKDGLTSFNNLQITDSNNKPLETKEQVKTNIERMGGITPFSSALYGYEASLSTMANDVFDSVKQTEKGEVGRDMAILSGLKGVMFQSVMLNQQLENKARSDYNMNVKQFSKLSQDNDSIKNNLEQIQNQNTAILAVLKEISASLKKIESK